MNLFLREMKANRKSLIIWSVFLFIFVAASMGKFGGLSGSTQSMNELMSSMPQGVKDLFGMNGFDLSSINGYFGVIFMYLVLVATIHSAMLGANILSKEETDKTAEFLFAKPISRNAIVKSKILAVLVNILITNLVISVSSIIFVAYYNKGASVTTDIINLMIGLYIMQLIFAFIGTAAAAVCKRPKAVGPIATAILLVTFFMSMLIDLNRNLVNLKFFTPFKYFDARNIINKQGLDTFFIVLSALIIVILINVTFVFYKKRDLKI
ncbi:MAG: ABC transporter permease subunit [Clostridia bacterium]|jgi:ABC-2 type transport system permease protein